VDYYYKGPAVGIENGTLLIGWPCKRKSDGTGAPFGLRPIAAWPLQFILRVAVIDPQGMTSTLDFNDLQFDPNWKRPK